MSTLESYAFCELLPKLLPNIDDLPAKTRPFIKQSTFKVQDLSEALNVLPQNCNNQLRAYLLTLLLIGIEKFDALESSWHDYLLYCVQFLKSMPNINTQNLFDRFCETSLIRAIKAPLKLETLLSEHNLLTKLKTNQNIDVSSYLSGIEANCKVKILDSLSNLEDIENALKKLKQVAAKGINLVTTKKLLLTLVAQYKEEMSRERLNGLKNELISLGVEYNGELEPAEKTSSSNAVGNIIKNRIIYLNNDADPKICIWECTKGGINGRLALKELSTLNLTLLDPYKNESDILLKLSNTNHPSFLKFYGSSLTSEPFGNRTAHVLSTEMEFIELTLKKHKDEKIASRQTYSEAEIMNIMFQLVNGLKLLSTLKIVHNDIKPSNILINEDFCIKIIDFNISRTLSYTTVMYDPTGTVEFMAPEVREAYENKSKVSVKGEKADVFSLGLTILYLVTDVPFSGLNLEKNKSLLNGLINGLKFNWLKQLLYNMLEFNPNSRIELNQIFRNNPGDISETKVMS